MFAFIQRQIKTPLHNLYDGICGIRKELSLCIPNLSIEATSFAHGTYGTVYGAKLIIEDNPLKVNTVNTVPDVGDTSHHPRLNTVNTVPDVGDTSHHPRLNTVVDCVLKIQSESLNDLNMRQISRYIESFNRETEIMLHLQDYDLSPRVYHHGFLYDAELNDIYHYIVMERLSVVAELFRSANEDCEVALRSFPQGTDFSELGDAGYAELATMAVDASNRMLSLGVCHRDYKWENIGYRVNNGVVTVVPFDFGLSNYIKVTDDPIANLHIERIRLYSSSLSFYGSIDLSDIQTLIDIIRIPEIPTHTIEMHCDAEDAHCIMNNEYFELYNSTLVTC